MYKICSKLVDTTSVIRVKGKLRLGSPLGTKWERRKTTDITKERGRGNLVPTSMVCGQDSELTHNLSPDSVLWSGICYLGRF